jgi:hypothetical protein
MTLFPLSPPVPAIASRPDLPPTPQPRRAPDFDFETGRFKFQPTADGKEFVMTDGLTTLRNRIQKILATERYQYVIYTPGFGIEFMGIAQRGLPRPVEVASLMTSIQQSIKYDPDVDLVVVTIVDDTTRYDGITIRIRVSSRGQTFDVLRTFRTI